MRIGVRGFFVREDYLHKSQPACEYICMGVYGCEGVALGFRRVLGAFGSGMAALKGGWVRVPHLVSSPYTTHNPTSHDGVSHAPSTLG